MEDKTQEKESEQSEIIKTIVLSSDWQEVITSIVVEKALDPLNIDITTLAEGFVEYLKKMESFDFRIPGRFILIASILLSLKVEAILREEEERIQKLQPANLQINLESPLLNVPAARSPTRKVTLTDLISALNKVMEIKKKKEPFFHKPKPEPVIVVGKAEDVEKRITDIYDKIRQKGILTFTDIVPTWRKKEIIDAFVPLLHLVQRGKIVAEQKEMFKEIEIKLR